MQVTINGVQYAPACAVSARIGIAITTHNRADVLSRALTQHGGAVVYPCWSLVDHADEEPVERHPDSAPRVEHRRAWRLSGCLR